MYGGFWCPQAHPYVTFLVEYYELIKKITQKYFLIENGLSKENSILQSCCFQVGL